eukprot:CAMPEP_0171004402 /NCGR_PEP_ID=MMETSP0736-20130129/17627_1 /TAXON_ID=186038 /ORGANISM="Fragilariopsis kerguelensis, Strain L26-C5" /LENGTH=280 /DNA_ID=CAMNT_0011433663 /DNA_START=57 /DNA_END=899 /DNA_ORIENTATION=+
MLTTSVVAIAAVIIVSITIIPDLSCEGFQLQSLSSSPALYSANGRRQDLFSTKSSPSSSSSSALNYLQGEREEEDEQQQQQQEDPQQQSVEDILGGNYQWNANEYDRNADYYRRRNEEYQQEIYEENTAANAAASTTTTLGLGLGGAVLDARIVTTTTPNKSSSSSTSSPSVFSQDPRDYWVVDAINTSLKPLYTSFKYVERNTIGVMQTNPLLAVSIFIVAGLFVAYISGFVFLDGYIETINPATNDIIPYWDDAAAADIHTLQRVVQSPLPLSPTMNE